MERAQNMALGFGALLFMFAVIIASYCMRISCWEDVGALFFVAGVVAGAWAYVIHNRSVHAQQYAAQIVQNHQPGTMASMSSVD